MSDSSLKAQGVALAVLESLLIAKGVLGPGDLSAALDKIAKVTVGTDAEAAEIFEDWAGMLAQVDEAHTAARH